LGFADGRDPRGLGRQFWGQADHVDHAGFRHRQQYINGFADNPYELQLGELMKSAGVFLGGLTSVLSLNLMLIGVCSSAPSCAPPAAVPPAVPPPIVRIAPAHAEAQPEPMPWGTFIWGCGGRVSIDPEGAVALPICLSRGR
jgi:hypothetical protein